MAIFPLALFLIFPTVLIATWSSVLYLLTRRYRKMNALMDRRSSHVLTLLNSFSDDARKPASAFSHRQAA